MQETANLYLQCSFFDPSVVLRNLRMWCLLTLLGIMFTISSAKSAENLALLKPATQSSTYVIRINPTADNAVDGNTDGDFDKGSCTHTKAKLLDHWWMVDLQNTYIVDSVLISNRIDCCSDWLNNFEVLVIHEDLITEELCKRINGSQLFPIVTYTCDQPARGRYVKIRKLVQEKVALILCEVEVYGRIPIPKSVLTYEREKGNRWSQNIDSDQSLAFRCALQRHRDNTSSDDTPYVQIELDSGVCRFLETESESDSSESQNWFLYKFNSVE